MKRDVLFLCQFFYPEYNSSATLPFDTARYLAQSGYSVDALCGYPREYNTSGEVSAREMKDGVSIHRLHYIQFSRRSKLGRLINYFSFTLSVLLRFLYKGIIIKHNKTEPTYTKTSLFLCEKRRFFMARTEKGVVTTI